MGVYEPPQGTICTVRMSENAAELYQSSLVRVGAAEKEEAAIATSMSLVTLTRSLSGSVSQQRTMLVI